MEEEPFRPTCDSDSDISSAHIGQHSTYPLRDLQARSQTSCGRTSFKLLMYFLLYTLVLTIVVSLFIKKGQQDVQDTAMNTKAQQDIEGPSDKQKCNVLFFADIHLEPFFSDTMVAKGHCRIPECMGKKHKKNKCSPLLDTEHDHFPRIGCDPPASLLESALKYANESLATPCAVIVGGDLIAHGLHLNPNLANAIQLYVLGRIKHYFPHSSVLFLIGNNDFLEDGTLSVSEFGRLWNVMSKTLVSSNTHPHTPKALSELNQASVSSSFLNGGYYSVSLSERCSTPLRVILLNTQMMVKSGGRFGTKTDRHSETKSHAAKQLKWFESELNAAKKRREMIIITGHIPPGIFFGKSDWQPWAQKKYIKLCDTYEHSIVAQLFGHHSKEMFRSLSQSTGLFITVGFSSLAIDKVKKIASYEAHFVNIQMLASDSRTTREDIESGWQTLYSFEEAYDLKDSSASSIHSASKKIMSNPMHGVMYKAILRGFMSSLPLHQMLCDASVSTIEKELECLQTRCMFDASRGCLPWSPSPLEDPDDEDSGDDDSD